MSRYLLLNNSDCRFYRTPTWRTRQLWRRSTPLFLYWTFHCVSLLAGGPGDPARRVQLLLLLIIKLRSKWSSGFQLPDQFIKSQPLSGIEFNYNYCQFPFSCPPHPLNGDEEYHHCRLADLYRSGQSDLARATTHELIWIDWRILFVNPVLLRHFPSWTHFHRSITVESHSDSAAAAVRYRIDWDPESAGSHREITHFGLSTATLLTIHCLPLVVGFVERRSIQIQVKETSGCAQVGLGLKRQRASKQASKHSPRLV